MQEKEVFLLPENLAPVSTNDKAQKNCTAGLIPDQTLKNAQKKLPSWPYL